MTREVFVVVEITGLDPKSNRVIELVALEARDSKPTGIQFHVLLDPDYPVEDGAASITGYDNWELEGLPKFADIAPAFVNFVRGSDLVVFTPDWDFAVIEAELARLAMPPLSYYVNSLKDARSRVMKLNLNVRWNPEKLSVLYDCREPVQKCTRIWRECFLLAQAFPCLPKDEGCA